MKISNHRMKGHRKAGLSETFVAEVVYRNHFRLQSTKHKTLSAKFKGFVVNSTWRDQIHRCLYQGIARKKFSEIAQKHKYIRPLSELICKSGFVVTFNFDDIVDEAVIERAAASGTPNPEIIFRPKVETRKNAPIIYHINGYLPREELRRASETLILTENAFADVLLSPSSHDAEFVINQFAVKSFLLMGVSLSDNSLKNLLRSSAKRNPANHHFIIYHERDGFRRSTEARNDIFDVNLNVYNLISLFMTTTEIKAFIELINIDDQDAFEKEISKLVTNKIDRKYYLVGSVASGKSSTLEALRCFQTYEEWSGRVPAAMYINDKLLTPKQQKEVDDFLFPQLISKNNKMARQHPGIRIMDRAYLDLFAFSKSRQENNRKGRELKRRFAELGKHFEDGHVFFLRASESALEERMARRGSEGRRKAQRRFDAKTLVKQERQLVSIYGPKDTSIFDTTDPPVGETARQIARKILLENYSEFAFDPRLKEILKQKGAL